MPQQAVLAKGGLGGEASTQGDALFVELPEQFEDHGGGAGPLEVAPAEVVIQWLELALQQRGSREQHDHALKLVEVQGALDAVEGHGLATHASGVQAMVDLLPPGIGGPAVLDHALAPGEQRQAHALAGLIGHGHGKLCDQCGLVSTRDAMAGSRPDPPELVRQPGGVGGVAGQTLLMSRHRFSSKGLHPQTEKGGQRETPRSSRWDRWGPRGPLVGERLRGWRSQLRSWTG